LVDYLSTLIPAIDVNGSEDDVIISTR
jgi:hypothetical protein